MSKKHSCPFQKGTFLPKDLILSKAFIELTKHGKTILLMIHLKKIMPGNNRSRQSLPKDTIINNGEIELSYPELYSYGLSDKSITRAFDDVVEKGFVRVEKTGGLGKGHYSKYRIIDDWQKYGTGDFEPRKRERSVKYGFCAKR